MIKKALSLENASQKEILRFKLNKAASKFKVSPLDTGSATV